MSSKKKPAPPPVKGGVLKDDLIDALLESEENGELTPPRPSRSGTQPDTVSRLAHAEEDVEEDVESASNLRLVDPNADPTASLSNQPAHLNQKVQAQGGKLQSPPPPPLPPIPGAKQDSAPTEDADDARTIAVPMGGAKPGAAPGKLQKLEDVLKKLRPNSAMPEKPSAKPVDKPEERPIEKPVERSPDANAKREPLFKPVPKTELGMEEKTTPIGVSDTPSPVPSNTPDWQDVKTELLAPLTLADNPEADPEAEQFMPTEIRPNSPGVRFREEARQVQPGAAIFSSAEAALRQSENLRVAQKRISDLEHEVERVRRENESLRSASETLRRRMDELHTQSETAELNTQEVKKIAEEERKVLKGQISSRDREIAEMRSRIDDAESRLEANFRKIRVRERDLEHRIEIIKAESQSIAASKDRMILELKRQIDQISTDLNHAKAQVQETFGQFKERQETARRAVRALRIALTVLEGDEDPGSRKAE